MPREKDSRLTEDQLIAAELLVYGATNKEVADQLDVCEKNYNALEEKTRIHGRT